MNIAFTIGAGAAGAALGIGSGWLNVVLERVERLREEEDEERAEYEAEAAQQADEARARGEEPETPAPWLPEWYGWTWLEWGMAPVLGAFAFSLFAGRQGLTWAALESFLWLAVFVQIVTFDLKHRLILDKVTYPATALALVLSAVTPGLALSRALTGALVIGGFFLLFHLVSRRGIGLGDAKLGALIGAVTGLGFDSPGHLQALYAVTSGVFLGGAVALLLLVTRLRSLRDPIPYGPFLCAGAVLVLFQSLPLT
jgi:Flp pilus assembly protein protease CpaA